MFEKIFKIICLVVATLFLVSLANSFETTEEKHKDTLNAYNDCRIKGASEQVCATLLGGQ